MFFKTHIRWVKVFSELEFQNDFQAGKIFPLRKAGLDLLFIKLKGELKVFEKKCPHQKASLEEAVCENGAVICPWHKYAFDLDSGKDLSSSGNPLKVFLVKKEEGYWFVGEEVKLPFWMDLA